MGYAAKLERPGGLVEVRQLAWLGKSGRATMRLLGRTVHVEGQAPTGKHGASPKRRYRWDQYGMVQACRTGSFGRSTHTHTRD